MSPKGSGSAGARRPDGGATAEAGQAESTGLEGVTFESALGRLESIVTRLERGEITLDESLSAFKEGSALVRLCLARLEAAEAAVQELVDGGGGEEGLKPFDSASQDNERDA